MGHIFNIVSRNSSHERGLAVIGMIVGENVFLSVFGVMQPVARRQTAIQQQIVLRGLIVLNSSEIGGGKVLAGEIIAISAKTAQRSFSYKGRT